MGRMMRVWAAVGTVALTLSGCGISFDVHADGEATVQSGGLLGSFLNTTGLDSFASFDISQTQDFKNQGVSKDHLDSVKLKSLSLKVKAPAGANFNFIDKIQFYAQLPNDDSSKVQIAHKDSVPRDTSQFNLDIDNVELLKYVVAPSMKITTSASGRPPAQDTTITVNVVFDVDPKL